MRRKRCYGLKIAVSVFSLFTAAAVFFAVFFAVKGYIMYNQAVDEISVEQKLESLKQDDSYVSCGELPEFYIDAVISVEDHRFYSHFGVDVIAVSRALWNDLISFSFAEGGSTITQQLAKNLYFTQEKQIERKFAEIFTAFDIESKYNKNEIFEFYVNTIYFGSGYYGIHDAAIGYYHKSPDKLSDYESAVLAGLPNAPSAYSPKRNPELAKQRAKKVLQRMVECNVIEKSYAESLLKN